jgi:hypothetical protein
VPSDTCKYLLFSPKAPHPPGVFLEVAHDDCSALIGPMVGPIPPAEFDQKRGYSLSDLLMGLGLGPVHDAQAHLYPVTVTYTGIFLEEPNPPRRKSREPESQYRERCAAAEVIRLEPNCHENVHVVRYEREPASWNAHDLECLMALAYQCLPRREPRWRESGAIVQERVGTGDGATPALRYCVHADGWWEIPANYTKNNRIHRVPLSGAAMELVARRLQTARPNAVWVFENVQPSKRSNRQFGNVRHRGKKAAAFLSRGDAHLKNKRAAFLPGLSFHFQGRDIRRRPRPTVRNPASVVMMCRSC